MKTDVQIAQEATLQPIANVAQKLGILGDQLELYGNHKAKVSLSVLKDNQDKPDGKLVLVTTINPTPAGEGKNDHQCGSVHGAQLHWQENHHHLKRTVPGTLLWGQRRCCRRRLLTGCANG
jgi:Formate-tetrahydrofolate ligase (EC 6.3.4.3)